jgi:acyl-CoA thioester hydrolase
MFEHAIEVEDVDIDMLGHASNIAFLRWIQEAAIAHSMAMGLDVEAYRRLGAFFVVRRHEVDYLRPALRGDSLLMRTWIDSAAAAKVERVTEFVRMPASRASGGLAVCVDGAAAVQGTAVRSPTAGEMVAKARTTWGFVEATTGRPTRIPDDIRIAFGFAPRKSSAPPPPVELAEGDAAAPALRPIARVAGE